MEERADDRSTRLEGEDAEHFAEVRALLDAAGVAYEDRPDPGPRPRLLHADDLLLRLRSARRAVGGRRRRPLRRPDRAARRPADAGGRLGGGDRADPARARRRARPPRRATPSSRSPRRTSAAAPWRSSASCAGRALGRARPRRRAASRASSSTPTGSAPAIVVILEADGSAQLRDMETGEQRAGRTPRLLAQEIGRLKRESRCKTAVR